MQRDLQQLHQRMLVTFVVDVSAHMAETGDDAAGPTFLEQCQLFVCLRVMEIVRAPPLTPDAPWTCYDQSVHMHVQRRG